MSLNQVELIGNLGQDPELRETPTGKKVASFRMATTEAWKNGNGELEKTTEWHDVEAWERTAENVAAHMKKGRQLYVRGRISTEEWKAKDGSPRSKKKSVADKVVFLGSGRETAEVAE